MPTYATTAKVSKERRAEMGSVCVNWAILESRVEEVIWALRGTDRKAGRRITHNMNITPRLILMKKLAREILADPKTTDEIIKQAALITKWALWRNRVVHGIWAKGRAKGTRRETYSLSYWVDPKGHAYKLDLAGIKTVTLGINGLIKNLDKLLKSGRIAPRPSP